MNRRVLLVILDGWGLAPAGKGNAISLAKTPNFDNLWSSCPHTTLAASGKAVGLPVGQIGNSEVGHLNIGAGRVILEDLPRITKSIKDGSFFENIALKEAFAESRKRNKPVHLMGLVSPGGVHSHQDHLFALLEMAKKENVPSVYIHVFTDGRDVDPQSALVYIKELEAKMSEIGIGQIATISGRYYAMDRDNRWDRTQSCYNALVLGRGELAKNSEIAIENSYKRGITDEFIRPTIINPAGLISDDNIVVFFNLRSDRPRELTKSLILNNFTSFVRENVLKNLFFVSMTEYEDDLPVNGIVFPPQKLKNTLSEAISKSGLRQFHIAETEKFAHVTFFFNGGREEAFSGEDRVLIPSPKVATYDLKPGMSAGQVSTKLMEKIGFYDFIVVNFANADMVGHTGKIPETVKAIETVDQCLGGIVTAGRNKNYDIVVVADHGNAEKMLDGKGMPFTAHTTNQVPFIYIGEENKIISKIDEPKLGNIAPTILDLMGITKPGEMTERSLLRKK